MEGKEEFLYEFLSHLGVTVGYLLLVSFFLLGFSFSFCIGGLLGMNILDLDHLLYVFTHLKEESCQKFVRRWHEKKYKEAIFHIVGSHKKYNRKLLHNAIFATALAVFAVWGFARKSGSPAIYVNQVRKGLPRLIEGTMRPWDNGTIGLFEGLCPWNAFETIKD